MHWYVPEDAKRCQHELYSRSLQQSMLKGLVSQQNHDCDAGPSGLQEVEISYTSAPENVTVRATSSPQIQPQFLELPIAYLHSGLFRRRDRKQRWTRGECDTRATEGLQFQLPLGILSCRC